VVSCFGDFRQEHGQSIFYYSGETNSAMGLVEVNYNLRIHNSIDGGSPYHDDDDPFNRLIELTLVDASNPIHEWIERARSTAEWTNFTWQEHKAHLLRTQSIMLMSTGEYYTMQHAQLM
jgi:hypothetical protein